MPRAFSTDLIGLCNNLPNFIPDVTKKDEVIWAPNGKFSIKAAWNAIRISYPVVSWRSLVWNRDAIPIEMHFYFVASL